jgi:hypothetical protein
VSRRRRLKGNWFRGGKNWATLSLGDINTGTWSIRLAFGRKADTYIYNKKYHHEIQRNENPESSKEGCGVKIAVLPMMMMFISFIMTIDV